MKFLESSGIHGLRAEAMAAKAIEHARSCPSGVWECSPMADDLRYKMATLEAIFKDKARIEDDLFSRLGGGEGYRIATSIPGVGRSLALVLLAEIGDPMRFRSPKSIVSYAGM